MLGHAVAQEEGLATRSPAGVLEGKRHRHLAWQGVEAHPVSWASGQGAPDFDGARVATRASSR
eukprot:957373-Pyramimonas_sp.AAC.1